MNSLPRHIQRVELLAEGTHDNQIRARKRQGWAVVRPGTYVPMEGWSGLDNAARHRLLVSSTLDKLPSSAISPPRRYTASQYWGPFPCECM